VPSGAAPAVFRQAGGSKAVMLEISMVAYTCPGTSSNHYADAP